MEPFSPSPHPSAFLVTNSATLDNFIFSVCNTRGAGLQGGKRTIVLLSRSGRSRCRSCPSRGWCHHEVLAVNYASRAGITDEKGVLDPDLAIEIPPELDESSPVPSVKSPTSYLPVPPLAGAISLPAYSTILPPYHVFPAITPPSRLPFALLLWEY